jgi:HAD superfamily hydrolase (TIGR01490 family)
MSESEPVASPPGVAFFDLDRTLIDINSGRAWVSAERKAGFITLPQLIKASWWITRYHMGWADLEAPLRAAIKALAGQEERAMEERVARFFEREVRGRVRPEAREALQAHSALGEPCALLTTSSIYLAREVSADLSLAPPLANRFEVREGRFTGEPEGPLCFGVGKLHAAERYASERGLSLDQCAFYTDAYADLPLLEVVGRPFVVCPDPKLRREAERRGWPVLWWSGVE